ncbi:MAG TPA: hypothetical protein VF041_02105 [Gemmatimonadaceae bacterium]
MRSVSVYGGRLDSEVPFALPPATAGDARWTLRRAPGAPRAEDAVETLGDDHVEGDARVRLIRIVGGYRLVYDDTGTFDVLDGGARIAWYPGPRATEDAVRLDVLGRVLPLALHASGTLCLHGSAVEIGGRGVAFLAPKRHGKSTLAQALARAGARVLSDDVVPVDPGPEARVRPGVPHVRLWRDAAARLAPAHVPPDEPRAKLTLDVPGATHAAVDAVPLAAVYLLAPVSGGARDAARRVALSPSAAAMAVLPQARLAPLFARAAGAELLEGVVRLAGAVPVYTLEVARDFARLDDVVARVMGWHAGVRAAARSGGDA